MNDGDKRAFRDLLVQAGEFYERIPSAEQMGAWWEDLEPFALEQIAAAFKAHRRDPKDCQFMPKPGQIIGRIQAMGGGDGWLEPNEAWAICPNSEDDTVVWCDEISAAYHTASDLLPDRVAARMAFLDGYRRLVDTARAQGRQPRWAVSLGHDSMQRQAALEQAVMAGRITRDHVARLTMTTPPDITDQRMLQLTDQASGDAARADAIRKIRSLLGRVSA